MRTVVIADGLQDPFYKELATYDLSSMAVKNCVGCWSCWWKTPGRCAFQDLNAFYHDYISADKAVFLCEPVNGFASPRLKTLFDRMLPLFLPYISVKTGESMHLKRYDRYPDVDFYYADTFESGEDRDIFARYIHRVFYQFHSENIRVLPLDQFQAERGGLACERSY